MCQSLVFCIFIFLDTKCERCVRNRNRRTQVPPFHQGWQKASRAVLWCMMSKWERTAPEVAKRQRLSK